MTSVVEVTVVVSHPCMMTPRHCFQTIFHVLQSLLINPKYFWLLATLTLAFDAILTKLIIHLVPCQLSRALFGWTEGLTIKETFRYRNRLGNVYDSDKADSPRST